MNEEFIKLIITRTRVNLLKQQLENKFKSFEKIDIPILSIQYKNNVTNISRKKMRLYLDIIDENYPLYKNADIFTKAEFIKDVFKCQCSKEDLELLNTFKQITKKKVIAMKDEKPVLISRLRWRSRENLNKNIIHFQN